MLHFAEQAILLIEGEDYNGLKPYTQMKKAATHVKSMTGKSKGVKACNLWNWTRPAMLAKLRKLCAEEDPSVLTAEGKHKGGRGKKKAGGGYTSRQDYKPWFVELELELDKKIADVRSNRIKVRAGDVRMWMLTLVTIEITRESENGGRPSDRILNFKASDRWLRAFFKRKGWVRRRATNKRSHSAEDLIGDVLGFVRFLRQLRRDNGGVNEIVYGRFGLLTTFNVDSVPMSFSDSSKTTYERKGARRVSIIVPGSGLDKRQATLHLCIPWVNSHGLH
jgi:hypothetical protein